MAAIAIFPDQASAALSVRGQAGDPRFAEADESWRSLDEQLDRAVDLLQGCARVASHAGVDPPNLEAALRRVRLAQRICDGLVTRLAARAEVLAQAGSGPGPEGLLTGRGVVTAARVRAETARARASAALPALGAAFIDARIGADHLDVVAGVVARAGEAELAALQKLDVELADAATRSSAETFGRRVHRVMARIRDQLGLSAEDAKESELRLWWGRDNTGRIAGRLTAEQHERVA
jgi:hypothetical protein